MASDNTVLNAGSGGETIRSLADASSINWPVGCSAYATTLTPGSNVVQVVTPAFGMPVQPATSSTWAATQSGTWNIVNVSGTVSLPTGASTSALQGTINTSIQQVVTVLLAPLAVTGTFWQATQPVSAVSLPLPTGAATSALQTTGNTSLSTLAGTVTAGTIAVNCTQITSPWVVSLSSTTITGTVAVTQSGSWSVTANAGTNLNTSLLALESGGNLATIAGAITSSVVQENVKQINGIVPLMGNGVTGAGSLRVTVASDNTAFSVNSIQSGTWNIGTVTTVSTVTAVTAITNALPAGSNLLGKVGIDQTTPGTTNAVAANQGTAAANSSPWPVTGTPQPTGGLLASSFISTNAVQATNVKASAGQIYKVNFTNIGSTPVYVRLYNKATAPASTDTPIWRVTVPGNTAGAGYIENFPDGLACSLGIGFRCTSGIADNDATALAASTVLGNIGYF